MNNTNSRRTKSGANRQTNSSNPVMGNNRSAFAGQARARHQLPGSTGILTTTITTGVVAAAFQLAAASDVTGFASRFGSTYDEYRVLGAVVTIRPISASTGVSKFWFDEKSTSTPTANEALEKTGRTLPNSNAASSAVTSMKWTARDLLDLEFTAIGTAVTPVTFKAYTNNAAWGAPVAVTNIFLVQIIYDVEFRGLKST